MTAATPPNTHPKPVIEPLHQPGITGAPRPPAYSPGLPFAGILQGMLSNPQAFYREGYHRFGPVFRLPFGALDITVLAGPEANVWIRKNEPEFISTAGNYDDSSRIMGAAPEVNMTNVDGEQHKKLRGSLQGLFAQRFLKDRFSMAVEVGETFFDEAAKGVPLDAPDFAKRLIYQQLGMTLANDAPPEYYEDFHIIVDAMIKSVLFPWRRYLPTPGPVRSSVERVTSFGKRLLSAHNQRESNEPRFFISYLLEGLESGLYQQSDFPLLLSVPFLAGIDTLGHSMSFTLYALLAHDDVRERCIAEVDEHMPPRGQEVTYDVMKKLLYLRWTIMEAMRMYPISPGLPRYVKADVEVNGYQLRKGQKLILPHAMPHFLDECYPDSDTFLPERFSPERGEHRTPGAYQPYGIGAHMCQGAGMADLQHLLNIALLLRDYELTLPPEGYDLDIQWIPTGMPRGLRMILRKR